MCFVGDMEIFLLISSIIVMAPGLKASVTPACPRPQLSANAMADCEKTSLKNPTTDDEDVAWFKKCVVAYYDLQPTPENTKQGTVKFKKPQFAEYLGTKFRILENTAKRIERFFLRNADWEATKKNPKYKTNNDDSGLLAITDARYLYVTYLLYILSGRKLSACKEDMARKTIVPRDVCFVPPYGSTTSTSDYDVGLIGHASGSLTAEFNKFFTKKFSKASEEVFDTNIYGYSLEYSMPQLFTGLSSYFMTVVPNLDFKAQYQMQELAGAYFKMYKFQESFYNQFVTAAAPRGDMSNGLGGNNVDKNLPNRREFFEKWLERYKSYDRRQQVRGESIRNEHNNIYSQLMNQLQGTILVTRGQHEDIFQYMADMSVALIYAAEAYHTRGAIRHVVGILQFKKRIIAETITVMDYWVSMIENWADANKVYSHCKASSTGVCLIKMCKYLYRTFNAMKNLHTLLSEPVKVRNALRSAFPGQTPTYPDKGNQQNDPEMVTGKWVNEFKGKRDDVPREAARGFLSYVGCSGQNYNAVLQTKCMANLQKKVLKYNKLLINITRKSTTEFVLVVMGNRQQKQPRPLLAMLQKKK